MIDYRVSVGVARGLVIGSCLFLSTCTSPTTPTPPPPPPPPPPAFTVACPANQSAVSHLNQPIAVTWPNPTSEGAVDGVSYSCSPASGTAFAPGAFSVTCSATDGLSRTASCGFQVTVTRPPQMTVTHFVAFGDSLTEGKLASQANPMILLDNPGVSYPDKLRPLLILRYTDQTFYVVNEGLGGETTELGVERLPGVLQSDNPEVLLLQEGANDLNAGQGSAAIPGIVASLDTMIRMCQARRVQVILANQPPQIPGLPRAGGAALVGPLNQELARLALRDNVPLVDIFTALNASVSANVGPDGLHLTPQGYQVMAQAFFDTIRNAFEPRTFR